MPTWFIAHTYLPRHPGHLIPPSPAPTAFDSCLFRRLCPTGFWFVSRWAAGYRVAEPALPYTLGAWLCLAHECPSVKAVRRDRGRNQAALQMEGASWVSTVDQLWGFAASPFCPLALPLPSVLETIEKQEVFPLIFSFKHLDTEKHREYLELKSEIIHLGENVTNMGQACCPPNRKLPQAVERAP